MTKKILTELPIGKIKDFIHENFKDINFTKDALDFFKKEYIGKNKKTKEPIQLKDGLPSEIQSWLKNEFDIKMDLSGEYAIAAVFAIILEFEKRAYFDIFVKNNKEYGTAIHSDVQCFKCVDRFKKELAVYKLNIKDQNYQMFISKNEIDLKHFDKNNTPLKSFDFKNPDDIVELSIPLIKFEEKADLSELFKNSTMVKKSDNKSFSVDSVKTYSMIDLGLDKVEVKQAAVMSFVTASGASVNKVIRINIEDDFYFYLQYKDDLIFASKMIKEDFIQDEELEKIKEEEEY